MATQALAQQRPAPFHVEIDGRLPERVVAKDVVLALLRRYGIAAGVGRALEYRGSTVRALPMEGRMTLCNMSIELGARFGTIAPDDTTFEYLHGRPYAPKGAAWDRALAAWRTLAGDDGEVETLRLDVDGLVPQITWGTTPADVADVTGVVPTADDLPAGRRDAHAAAVAYMGLVPGLRLDALTVDVVFIGSCTNARLSDLRAAAAIARGRTVAPGVRALVVPGSQAVRAAAEREGLHRVFRDAGFEWREPGCSMCLAINDDVVPPRARCVSTSNRNFESRQGREARTHLASPLTAAASAIAGRIADPGTLA